MSTIEYPVPFSKYHGLGNHFVIVDNRQGKYDLSDSSMIITICDVRTGIGADGLLEIVNCDDERHQSCLYKIVYHRCNGEIGRFCGNGARCSVDFGCHVGIAPEDEEFAFCAFDGEHRGRFESKTRLVYVSMIDVDSIEPYDTDNYRVSDIIVTYVERLDGLDMNTTIDKKFAALRKTEYGSVVIFVELKENDEINIRSWESPSDGETWACGTGAVGAALTNQVKKGEFKGEESFRQKVNVRLGQIQVKASRVGEASFVNIWMIGPTCHVFDSCYTGIPTCK